MSDILKENDNEILIISSIFDASYKIYLIAKIKRKDTTETITTFLKVLYELIFELNSPLLKNLTPYLHAAIYHLPGFLETFGNIDIYNLQGMEKLNRLLKMNYHRNSNKSKFYSLK